MTIFNQANQISLSEKSEEISNKSQLLIDEHEFYMWGDESSFDKFMPAFDRFIPASRYESVEGRNKFIETGEIYHNYIMMDNDKHIRYLSCIKWW